MFSLLLRGFALGFAIAASPGPIFFLCVRRTLLQGRLAGVFSGFGVATADAFYAAIATFGVAALAAAFVAGRRPLAVVGGGTIISFAALAATLGLGTGGSFVRPALVVGGVLLGSAAWWCILVVATSLLRARMTPAVVRGISTFSGLAIAVLGILAVISAFSG